MENLFIYVRALRTHKQVEVTLKFRVNIDTYIQDSWNTCSDILILTFNDAYTNIQEHVNVESKKWKILYLNLIPGDFIVDGEKCS